MTGEFDHTHEQVEQRHSARTPPEQSELTAPQRVASAVGNHGFAAFARLGEGILPDGRAHPDVEATIARTRGGGLPLDHDVRDRFGPALGDSLDGVRVHTGPEAEALTDAVAARAFATGSDVYFGRGEYNPGSSDGQRLLAHELTHTVQQAGASASGPLIVSTPGDPLEREADQAADSVAG